MSDNQSTFGQSDYGTSGWGVGEELPPPPEVPAEGGVCDGWGIAPLGHSEWGGRCDYGDNNEIGLIIQPSTFNTRGGASFQVACLNVFDGMTGDSFGGDSLNNTFWNVPEQYAADTSVNNSLFVSVSGQPYAYFTMDTAAQVRSGSVSIEFDILSDVFSRAPQNDVHFAAITLRHSIYQYVRLSRMYSFNTKSHQVAVECAIGGVQQPRCTFKTESTNGSLQISFWGGNAFAYYNGVNVWSTRLLASITPAVRVESISGMNGFSYVTAIRRFSMQPLVVIGDQPAFTTEGASKNRVVGSIPKMESVGDYSVKVYDYRGLRGSKSNGFKYVLPDTRTLSSEKTGTLIANFDKTIRGGK